MNNVIVAKPPEIWFIPGANSSPLSFQSMKQKIWADPRFSSYKAVNVHYNSQEPLQLTVGSIIFGLKEGTPVFLVGHSLGGVIATLVSQWIKENNIDKRILGVITLGTPLGGCEEADFLQYLFPFFHLFKSISPRNPMLQRMVSTGVVCPTLNFITSSGNNPVLNCANDGVVSIRSQRSMKGGNQVEVATNHFEVLQSDFVIEHLKEFMVKPHNPIKEPIITPDSEYDGYL